MRSIFFGIIGVVLFGVAACTSGGGSVTAPSPLTNSPVVVGDKPTEAPCNGCSFSAEAQGLQIRLSWSGFAKSKNASCSISTNPSSGSYQPSPCDEGTMMVPTPVSPTTYTLTVNKNEGNDPPQVANAYIHGPFGTFAGPTTANAGAGHHGWLTVVFGAINGETHSVTATWRSEVAADDDPGIVYEGSAVGTDPSMSVNATSSTRCQAGEGSPQATFSGSFTVVDPTHITGSYNGSACHPSAGTFSLTRQ